MKKNLLKVVAIVLLVGVLATVFCACNAKTYTKKLEKAGYEVETVESSKEDDADIEWSVYAVKVESILKTEIVTVTKYADKDDAKKVESDAIKSVGEDCVYRTGKIVIIGTSKQAVKDAK